MKKNSFQKTLFGINSAMKAAESVIVIVTVFLMAIMLIAAVFCRKVLNNSLTFTEELGTVMMVTITYIGSVYAVRGGKHIIMNILVDVLPMKSKKILVTVTHLVTALFMLILAYFSFNYLMSTYELNRITSALRIPYCITLIPMVAGLFFTGIQFLVAFIMNLIDKEDIYVGSERKYSEQQEARSNQ